MERGKVKFFNATRGYGFIMTDQGEEVFFHRNDVKETGFRSVLQQGDTVTFDLRPEPKGKRAVNVVRYSL
ncbi:MAG: cold shock domain-containing protein [Bacteroidota bacterium]